MIERSRLDWIIDDACTRMRGAATNESRLLWAQRMNDAKRERGDFNRPAEPEKLPKPEGDST